MDEKTDILMAIGRRIRGLRTEEGLTLQDLAERTGLSTSTLSLLERGKAGPSIGTLMVISSALGVQMSELLEVADGSDARMVSRATEQKVFATSEGVVRRVLKFDRDRGLEIAINEYDGGTRSNEVPRAHEGFEYGVVLEGRIEISVNGEQIKLEPGDLISYNSSRPHMISNSGPERARALWVNLKKA